jgi:SAM-dependent methyltransferase
MRAEQFDEGYLEAMQEEELVENDPDKYYKIRSIEYGPEGGRGLDEYENDLLFDRRELENKVVLDLGAGPELKLAKGLKESGINARVISLSPNFQDQRYKERAERSFPEGEIIASTGQKIPLEDESCDYIFTYHVVEHIGGYELEKIILEMARILKKNGTGKIGPIPKPVSSGYEKFINEEDLKEKLEKLKIEITIEDIPKERLFASSLKLGDDDFNSSRNVTFINIVLKKKL